MKAYIFERRDKHHGEKISPAINAVGDKVKEN